MSVSIESAIDDSNSYQLCHYVSSDKNKSLDKDMSTDKTESLDKVKPSDKEQSPCESSSCKSSDKVESSDRNDTLDKSDSSVKHESSDMLLHRTESIEKPPNKSVPLDKAQSPDKDKASGFKFSDKDELSTKTESLDKVGSIDNNDSFGIINPAESTSDDKLVDFKFCESKQSDEAVTSINSSLISSCGDKSAELRHPVTNNNIASSFSSSLSLTSSSSTVVLSSSSPSSSSSSSCPSITSSTDCTRVKTGISTNYGEGKSSTGTPCGETTDNVLKLEVTCGPNSACLHMSRLQLGSKGTCVLFDNAWLTPNEFQYVSGRETAKDWKRSIKHHGKSLKVLIAKGILSTAPPHCACSQCAQGSKGLEKEDGKGDKISVMGNDYKLNMKETSCASKTLLPSALSVPSSSSSSSSSSTSLSSCGPCTEKDLTRCAGQSFSNRSCNISGAVVVSSHRQNSPIVSSLRSNTSPVNLSNTAAHNCSIEHRKDDGNNNSNNDSNRSCCSDSNISNHGKLSVEWSSERLSDLDKIERKRKHSDSSEGKTVNKRICTAKDLSASADQRSPSSNRGDSVREEKSEDDLNRERFLSFLSSRPFLTNTPLFSKAAESVIPQPSGFNGSLAWSIGPQPDMKYPIVPLLDIKYPSGTPSEIKYPTGIPPDIKYPTGPPSDIKVPQYPSLAPPSDSSDYWLWWRRMAEGMLTPPTYPYPPQIKSTPDPWGMYLHNLLPNKNIYPELPPAPWTHCSPIPPQLLNLSHYPQDPLQFRLYPTPTPVTFNPSPYIPPEILAEFYNRTAFSNPFTPRFCL